MKKFNIRLTSSFHNALLQVEGSTIEKTALKKHLTVYNKGVGWQLKKAKEKMEYLEPNHLAHPDSEYFATQYYETKKLIEELKDSVYEEYYTETDDGDLFIPAGLHYLGDCDVHLSKVSPVFPDLGGGRDWRPYQVECITEMLRYKRSIGVLATGLGKSLIILGVCASFVPRKKRVCVIVPNIYLVGQVYDLLTQHFKSVTRAGDGHTPKLGADILITTMQSALQYVGSYDVIITDESHHSPSSTLQEIFLAAEKAEYVYGLTATPFRSDGLDLGIYAYCGPIVYERDVKWGIQHGWLMDPMIFVHTAKIEHPKVNSKSLATSAYKHLCGHPQYVQNVAHQVNKALVAGRKCLVITKTLAVAKALRKHIPGSQVADAKFKKPLNDFREGKIEILIATVQLVSEGIDIPLIDALFVATQHSSITTTYQSLGRALRLSSDKKRPIIMDFAVAGYEQFETAKTKRLDIYNYISKEVKLL